MNEDAGCNCKRCWPSCQTVAKWWAVRCKTLRAYARDADLLAMVAAQADQVPALIRHRSFLEGRGPNGRLPGTPG